MSDYPGIVAKLKEAKKKSKGEYGLLVEQYAYHFYKGVMYFYSNNIEAARINFTRASDIIERKE